jgi:hypothetical protein
MHHRETQEMRELGLVVAAAILTVQPGLEEAAQLGIERPRQLRLLGEQRNERSVEGELEVRLPGRGLVESWNGSAARGQAGGRTDLQRLFEPQSRQPIAQHVLALLAAEHGTGLVRIAGQASHRGPLALIALAVGVNSPLTLGLPPS